MSRNSKGCCMTTRIDILGEILGVDPDDPNPVENNHMVNALQRISTLERQNNLLKSLAIELEAIGVMPVGSAQRVEIRAQLLHLEVQLQRVQETIHLLDVGDEVYHEVQGRELEIKEAIVNLQGKMNATYFN